MPYVIDAIDPSATAMIVIDMQNDFIGAGATAHTKQSAYVVDLLAETLAFCRRIGIRVLYTAHVHRSDGSDVGLYGELYPAIANRTALIDGTPGTDIYPALAPPPGEHIIKKHRYSAFFATDLDLILREWGIDTVVIAGATTENCCHATARDAMYHNYKVAFLSDGTCTIDYPDTGHGPLSAAEVHRMTLIVLAYSTAHVMTTAEFRTLAERTP